MQKQSFETEVGGRKLSVEFNDLAEQASGSAMVRYGDTIVLATAVMSERTADGLDYFPLTVDFEEKFYAAGAILGSRFMRREGRPSEQAILSGRIVDRTIRPLFDHHIRNEVQVIVTVLSLAEDDPDVLGVNAASLALATSDIPWNGPSSAVRIGKLRASDELIVNPTYAQRAEKDFEFELLACGKDGVINMIEIGAKEVPEEVVVRALARAQEVIDALQKFQREIAAALGKQKRDLPKPEVPAQLQAIFDEHVAPKLDETVFCSEAGKARIYALKKVWKEAVATHLPESPKGLVDDLFEEAIDETLHRGAVERNVRADGRGFDEVRPLFAQAGGVSPMLHGSGIFYRGGTHVFTALTLGGPQDSQLIDSMEDRDVKKRFMHHYNFPPFSAGETGRLGGLNRRMVGHGALAEKALEPMIPTQDAFPYTIRLVSECMASNGSTSMGSVCASTLALMDGGVPILRPVAGIAIGLMQSREKYAILTDIQGPEDQHGDMDFKVAGTSQGITAVQMDVKVEGVPVSILAEAFEKARAARTKILDVIAGAIPAPRPEISPRAPHIVHMQIRPDQIGKVIGSGGKIINKIREESGVVDISIEDDGTIFITGVGDTAANAAKIIADMTREYHAGERFDGVVSRLATFGAFVKLNDSAEGLVHISEIAPFRLERVESALALGETVPVVIKEIDEQGRINLSIKSADPEFAARKGLAPKNGTERSA